MSKKKKTRKKDRERQRVNSNLIFNQRMNKNNTQTFQIL